jgi:hypothetical protein
VERRKRKEERRKKPRREILWSNLRLFRGKEKKEGRKKEGNYVNHSKHKSACM